EKTMNIIIENAASVERKKTWVRVALPVKEWDMLPKSFIMPTGEQVVTSFSTAHSGFVHVRGDWKANKRVVLNLDERYDAEADGYVTSAMLAGIGPADLVPTFKVMTEDDVTHESKIEKISL